jgi:outer membrane cobalamin receptor
MRAVTTAAGRALGCPRALAAGSLDAVPAASALNTERAAAELAEVVVTGRKRTGILETTPMTVKVLNARDIKEQSVTRTSDLASCVPSLTFTSAQGEGAHFSYIRGMGFISSTRPTVGLVVDGIDQEGGTSINGAVLDVEPSEGTEGLPSAAFALRGRGGVSQHAG